MTERKAIGKRGEALARDYFESLGAEIVEQNYQFRRAEIDLIVILNNELLVFVEVKYRSRSDYGAPEIFVSKHQRNKIKMAANAYLHGINWHKDVRFDIIAIDGQEQIEHFEDAFY